MALSTDLLLQAMRRHGLDPGDISWDGCLHGFASGSQELGNTAWYIARPDGRAAVFGDASAGLKMHWAGPSPDTPGGNDPGARAEQVAAEVDRTWSAARRKAESDHPCLANRGITTGLEQLRVSRRTKWGSGRIVPAGLLLIPFRRQGGDLVNLQMVWPDGRNQLWRNAPVHDTWMPVGGAAFKRGNRRLYLCHSWATGWTLHRATGCAVIVAPSRIMLHPVAIAIQEKWNCDLVIAADDDRWNVLYAGLHGHSVPNPGLFFAREAAEEVGATLVAPEFASLRGVPTSLADLGQREGLEAVRRILDGNSPGAQQRVDPRAPLEDEEGFEEPGPEPWVHKAPFRPLGYRRGTSFDKDLHMFLTADGQVVSFTLGQLGNPNNLFLLSMLEVPFPQWWQEHFPGRTQDSVAWRKAAVSLARECRRRHRVDPRRVRETGCWRDDDGNVVVHFGDRLLPPGATGRFVPPQKYPGGSYVYPKSFYLVDRPKGHLMDAEEARQLLAAFEGLAWDDEISGALLAGWVALAPLCGALEWRPQLLVTGAVGTGRGTLVSEVVPGLLANLYCSIDNAAEARKHPQEVALPLVWDWYGEMDKDACRDLEVLLALARKAALPRAGDIPGDVSPSMFLLSIESPPWPLYEPAGKCLHRLHLRAPALLASKGARYQGLARMRWLSQRVDLATGNRLFARTLQWFRSGMFDRLLEVTSAVADELLPTNPKSAGYGILAAGAWMLKRDVIPSQSEVAAWFRTRGVSSSDADIVKDGHRVLANLLRGEAAVSHGVSATLDFGVKRLIDIVVAGKPLPGQVLSQIPLRQLNNTEKARKALMHLGLRVEDEALLIANRSDWISEQLRDTPWSEDWAQALGAIPRAHAGPVRHVNRDRKSRTTVIPLKALAVATAAQPLSCSGAS